MNELRTSDAGRPRSIVLLTDGKQNSPPMIGDVLPDIIAAGVRVFAIALEGTEGVDDALLQDVAQRTGGRFFLTAAPTDLQSIYASVAGAVAGRETLFTTDHRMWEGEEVSEFVQIDASVQEALFAVSWANGSNRISLTLQDPSGRNIDKAEADSDPNIEFFSGATYVYYRIRSPRAGLWHMKAMAEQVVTSTAFERAVAAALGRREPNAPPVAAVPRNMPETLEETVRFSVQGSTLLTLNATADRTHYVVGDPVVLTATASLGRPLTNLTAIAEVRRPDGGIRGFPLVLSDNGTLGDQLESDGVFTSVYSETTAAGTYQFFLTVTGTSPTGEVFRRETTVTVVVNPTSDSDNDGLPDDWETSKGLDRNVNDSSGDPDSDGLTNFAEFAAGTEPLFDDTDEDRLRDGDEVHVGTDPLNPDTDQGGESDGNEAAEGRNPLDPADDYLGPGTQCLGDCSGDGEVTIDELVTMVNIALGTVPPSDCSAGDSNSDGEITIDEIIQAVNRALAGC